MAYLLVLLGALLRVMPHPGNFAPIGALALFGGVYLNKKMALILPIAAMVVSDFFIGFDSWESRLSVYGSFILIGLVGLWVRNHKSFLTVVGGSLTGSVLFYLITNLVFLYDPSMYPHTWQGQITSYINALPFFRNTLLGDLFYVSIFFGAYEFVKKLQNRSSLSFKGEGPRER